MLNLNYTVSKDNIHIEDSYQVFDKNIMKQLLEDIKSTITSSELCEIFEIRTMDSLIAEWRAHNLLYDLGLFKDRTKDVDLNNEPKFMQFAYSVLSLFYFK